MQNQFHVVERSSKNKIRFFSFGVIAGVTIGVVFAVGIKSLLGHFNDLSKGILKIDSRQDEISQRLDSIQGEIANQNKKPVAVPIINNTSSVAQPIVDDTKKPEEKTEDTVKRGVDSNDTLAFVSKEENYENAIIMTNQLVSVSNISLTSIDSSSTTNDNSDSLLASLNETPQINKSSNWRIEFWQSPLNFKGYKMSLDKIVLYGINSNISFRLVKWNDLYYLVSNQDAYVVDFTDEPKPFDKVVDKNTLKKFNL